MTDPQVLVVDDDPALVTVLTVGFQARGYDVRAVGTGAAALEAVDAHEPDIIILDLGLPDLDGLEVCRHLRARTRTSIIVLSADGAEDRKVAALDLGADDYLTKPFSLPELLARTRVAIRHRNEVAGIVDDDVLRVGPLVIDGAARTVHVEGRPLDLSPKEYALLVVLARNSGKVLTHRMLLDHVWGRRQSLDTLRVHVSALRRKLAEVGGGLVIRTEPGVGYRLLVDGP